MHITNLYKTNNVKNWQTECMIDRRWCCWWCYFRKYFRYFHTYLRLMKASQRICIEQTRTYIRRLMDSCHNGAIPLMEIMNVSMSTCLVLLHRKQKVHSLLWVLRNSTVSMDKTLIDTHFHMKKTYFDK